MERYCLYLRKSLQTVKLRPGARLKHWHVTKKILMELLMENCILLILVVYGEIVSGETISARPVYAAALSEVEKHMEWSTCRGSGAFCPAVILSLIRASFPEHFPVLRHQNYHSPSKT